MSDDDLIRRGDALKAVQYHVTDDDDRNTLSHAIAALPARGVGVKPLVWEQISDRTIEAAGVGSTYRIQTAQDGSVRWQSRYMGEWHNAPSIDAAKDAAQADYEARILAALEPALAALEGRSND